MNAPPLDDRDGVIWLNGKLVPWRDAKVHVLTHSLHYGNAVFEGDRVYNGKVFKLSEHSARLIRSAKMLAYDLPYSVAELDAATKLVVAENKLESGYVRPLAWRGPEVIGVSAAGTKIHVMIAAFPWGKYFSQAAIRICTSRWKRPSPESSPAGSKAAGLYVICTLARDEAAAAGYQDALMHDYKGRLSEATGANLFLVFDGELHTPTTETILNGITRQTVMELARKRGITVVEREIYPEELARASEVFLTGTAVEVQPVGSIDEREYPVGPISTQLQADYAALVRA
ncbi:branched-chain amino acid aminotransferase [Urbifossiella limnaea]|uniref:Branched-chain-amino-acid aminotransferase n=1 Tax=Urbifossiella limnaea TaxID=2528023 RepID=A0A517XN23_9BACT|nr:branched-chain amino acid aminotransferase [Urbifossiella limnaea]QDU18910.1 Branched-chain-amino-acid aminotransferase [Urbifossiella limnaea]